MSTQCPFSGLSSPLGVSPHGCSHCAATKYAMYALVFIGLITVSYYALTLLRTVLDTTLRRGVDLKHFGAKKGAWAVVTGATDGIGKAFSQQLAKAGFNIVLVSRTLSKLEACAEEIKTKYDVETKVVTIDFSRADASDYDRLRDAVQDIHVGVLVNNVGTNHEFPVRFQDESMEVLEAIVEVNVAAQVRVTRIILPQMAARKNGLIINLGSLSGVAVTPLMATYAASKSFVRSWSQALGEELASQGVLVECLDASYVVSNMSKIRRATWSIPSADTFVSHVLKRIGIAGGSAVPYSSSPYLPHALTLWAVERLLPRKLTLSFTYSSMQNIRQRALAKRAREAKSN
jgi:17beta-estradiol 17-dehydrogenase / very-long-chain 3-oxoacyl-CoA reductase